MRNRDLGSEVPADILFVRLRLLGDIIFTIPALEIYKQHRPHGRVYYVVEERFRELAEIIPGIDEIISVPSRPGWRDIWNFRKKTKELNIRTAVDFHSGPTSALLTLASGASLRVGYRTPNRNWAYTRLLSRRHEPFPTHSVLNQARLLEKIGITVGAVPAFPVLNLSPYPVSGRVDALRGIRPKVIMHLGSGNRFRDWGLDNFSALVGRLSAARIPVVFIGRSAEEARRAASLSHFPYTHDLSGPLSVRDLLDLIAGASVYVGADSGPLHLASLTATPLVAFFGPNLAEISGPWRKENVEILQLDMPCRPCSQRRCKYDTISCMRHISVEQAYDAVKRFIK